MTTNGPDPWLPIGESARRIGVSTEAVRRWVENPSRYHKLGNRKSKAHRNAHGYWELRESLVEWLREQHEQKPLQGRGSWDKRREK